MSLPLLSLIIVLGLIQQIDQKDHPEKRAKATNLEKAIAST